MTHNYYGPEYSNEEIEKVLKEHKIKYEKIGYPEKIAAKMIFDGKIIGWFQGKMEFGQRALGNRSILASPLTAEMKDKINASIKFRESFRPFAPAVLQEKQDEYFETDNGGDVPFMEKVYMIKPEKQKVIPAVTHVDGSGRIQSVLKSTNKKFHDLIAEFEKLSTVPVVLNTSFNLNGEAIVCSPKDAIKTFISCGMDALFIGNYLIEK
jgi:carbamoyltransferase